MQLLDGKATARQIRAEVATEVSRLRDQQQEVGLGVVLVGDDPASHVYVGMKERACADAGITSYSCRLPATASREETLAAVHDFNTRPEVHGILVQHPLPPGLDEDEVFAAIAPAKDVDGVGPVSMGRLLADQPGFAACTAAGIMALLEAYDIPIKGRHCVVVGRSLIVGKPVAMLLLRGHGTVTVCHSRTRDLPNHVGQADIVIAALGKPEFITGEMLKTGAVVVDAGYNRVAGRTGDVGDVAFDSAAARASWITPVPGGVGPMTIAILMRQTLQAAIQAVAAPLP